MYLYYSRLDSSQISVYAAIVMTSAMTIRCAMKRAVFAAGRRRTRAAAALDGVVVVVAVVVLIVGGRHTAVVVFYRPSQTTPASKRRTSGPPNFSRLRARRRRQVPFLTTSPPRRRRKSAAAAAVPLPPFLTFTPTLFQPPSRTVLVFRPPRLILCVCVRVSFRCSRRASDARARFRFRVPRRVFVAATPSGRRASPPPSANVELSALAVNIS